MANCIFCGTELTPANAHKEHIITNALGGRLKSRKLDCKTCNNTFGGDCDAKLAKDMNPLANLLGIDRDDGEPQPIRGSMAGKPMNLFPGGKPGLSKPEMKITETGKEVNIKLAVRSRREARKMLEGLARKYAIDVEKALEKAETKSEYLDDHIELKFAHGGTDTFRGVVKMAYLFLKHKRPDLKFGGEEDIVAFIKGEHKFRRVFFFEPRVEVVARPPGQLFHSIIVKSYRAEKMLVAFVDLFSVLPFAIILSEDFTDDILEHYVFDILERREVTSLRISLPHLERKSLNELFSKMPTPAAWVKRRFEAFLSIVHQRQVKFHHGEMIEKARNKSLKRYPEGTTITPEMIDEFVSALMEELTPYVAHNLKGRK